MTTIDEPTRVRLTGRRGLLAAVPAMLGFHPQESLVMVCLSGARRRVGPVIRADLNDPVDSPGPDPAFIAQLLSHARHHADEVALVCYTETTVHPAMFAEVIAGLESRGVLLDAVLVRGGRVYPARSGSWSPSVEAELQTGARVPDDDDPAVLALAAASALHGRGVLADRQALRDSIAGPTGAAARKASAALHAAADDLLGRFGRQGPIDRGSLAHLAEVNVKRALLEVVGRNGISAARSALIAILLCDTEVRDQLICTLINDLESPYLPALIAVARATPDADAAQVCAVLAIAAYRHGDGALAQVAVDRCLSGEPGHRLAQLMLGVMEAGLPPEDLVHLTRRGSRDLASGRPARRASRTRAIGGDAGATSAAGG